MGLWKERIDNEIGEVSWNKRAVHDKLQKQKQSSSFILIPTLLLASVAIAFFLLTIPNEEVINRSASNEESISLLEKMSDVEIKEYYYSAFTPIRDHFFEGVNESYLGMKKGDKLDELKLILKDLEYAEGREYSGYAGEGSKDLVVVFEDGTHANLRVDDNIIYDVDSNQVYYDKHYRYYHLFQGELESFDIKKWIHAIFLILIGFNLIFTKFGKQVIVRKFKTLSFHLAVLICTWCLLFIQLKGTYNLTKTVFIMWLILYLIAQGIFVYLMKFKGQELRFEIYKGLLYLGAFLFVWNKFFF